MTLAMANPSATPPGLLDFPDWLSPVAVKELRQALRGRVFISNLLLIQALTVLQFFLTQYHEQGIPFWSLLFVLFLGIPLRGLFSISREFKENTMEVLVLAIPPLRVVFDKWIALFLQSLLLICSILPYVILRSLAHGLDFGAELACLGWLLWGIAILTGLAISSSPYMLSAMGRSVIGVGAFILFIGFGTTYGITLSSGSALAIFFVGILLLPIILALTPLPGFLSMASDLAMDDRA